MTTRSFYQSPLASETAFSQRRNSSLVGTSTALQELNGVKDAPATYSVQFFSNQNTRLQDGDSKQKFKGMIYKRKRGKKDNSLRVEEFTFATAQGVHESDKVVMEEKTDKTENAKTETLKTKLWEILGTVSSPKGLHSNIQAPEVGPSNLKPAGTVDQIGDTTIKLRQNSDTIEMDTESPENTIKRPETRSLTRKKAPSKVQPNETASTRKQAPKRVQPHKPNFGSSSKQKHRESFFCFGGQSAKLDGEVKRASFIPGRKKIQKIHGIVPRKINFSTKANEDDIQETSHRKRTPVLPEKTSLFGNIRSFHGCFAESKTIHLDKVQDEGSLQQPVTNIADKQLNFDNPTPEKEDQQEDIGDSSKRNVVDLKDGFESSTLGIKTRILSPCPSSSPQTVQMEQGACSPTPSERRFTMGNIRTFKTFQTSRDCFESNDDAEKLADSLPRNWMPTTEKNDAENELSQSSFEEEDDMEKLIYSSPKRNPRPTNEKNNAEDVQPEASSEEKDDAERPVDSSSWKPMLTNEKNDAEKVLSDASSEEKDSENSEGGSPVIKRFDSYRKKVKSPKIIQVEKQKFMRHSDKMFHNNEGARASGLSPTLPSPKGAGESDWFEEPSGQNQHDELARAVTLFASALENFKRKMDSTARKKSSEILMSMSEEIKLKLQNTESQIESDVGKLTSLCKSKRKHLETRLQEQQKQLKLIHEKFKEDVHHHLLDCRSTLEGLEAHQNELKGNLKRQKVSPRKLLMQAEEAVEVQLSDAERQIMDVHESARGKMLQLKRVIAEFLKEEDI